MIQSLAVLPVFKVQEEKITGIEIILREHGFVSANEQIMNYLEKFVENSTISFMDTAMRYIMADQPDKAMGRVEKGFEELDPADVIYRDKDLLS